MKGKRPEETVREILEECGDCDVCRYLMDEVCFFFPALFNIWDKEKEKATKVNDATLTNLLELCHFCGLCPCPSIRFKIIRAKTEAVTKDGLKFSYSMLDNLELLWNLIGKFNLLKSRSILALPVEFLLKKLFSIHTDRVLPQLPEQSFDAWAASEGLTKPCDDEPNLKVAYFVGCTGRFLFPQVAEAVSNIFRKLNVPCYVFKQHCCGMPALLEGDKEKALKWLKVNMKEWRRLIEKGYDIVCSCPTCSFMIREVLPHGAVYSEKIQKLLGSEDKEIRVPLGERSLKKVSSCLSISRSLYEKILTGQEYFLEIDPVDRLMVAQKTYDLGEYILKRLTNRLKRKPPGNINTESIVYFAPCHQREQKMGKPYIEIFETLGTPLTPMEDSVYCCGLGGIIGLKENYHEKSVFLGKRLINKLTTLEPTAIVTECLGCRIQLSQLSSWKIYHPAEILWKIINLNPEKPTL